MLRDDPEMLNQALRAALDERDKRSIFWRKFRNELIGIHWRDGLGTKRVSNYVYSYVSTFMPVLAFRTPKVKLRPRFRAMNQIVAEVMQQAVNNTIVEANFLEELRLSILDSFYAFGLLKTGLRAGSYGAADSCPDVATIDGGDGPYDPLMPFAVRVSPFDAVWDDTAKHWRHCQFIGHEFDRDLEVFLSDPRYDLSGIDVSALETSRKRVDHADARPLSRGERDGRNIDDQMPETVRLCEMYLAGLNRIVTLVKYSRDDWGLVRSSPFYGSGNGCGPYHMLGYTWVPDAVLPLAPAQSWWSQWCEIEEQERELLTQVKNEKTIVAFKRGAADSARIVKDAQKHSIVTGVDDVGTQVTYGGVTQQKLVAVSDARARFEFASGLSDIIRGVPTRGDKTATEVSISDRYANVRIEDMQLAIRDFSLGPISDFMFYLWNDPNVLVPLTYEDPETRQPIDILVQGGVYIDPETGQPDDALTDVDFYIEIDRESMYRNDGPLDRMQAYEDADLIFRLLTPAAMAMGYMPDAMRIIRRIGERIGWDGLEGDFIPLTPEAMLLQAMSQQFGARPDNTKGMQHTGGDKEPLNVIPGGQTGALMKNLMTDSPMMRAAGMQAAPLGLSQRGRNASA